MLYVVVAWALLLLLAFTAVSVSAAAAAQREKRVRLSERQVFALGALAAVAVVVAIILGNTAGDLWPLLPFVVWAGVFRAIRNYAQAGPERQAAQQRAQIYREAERRRQEAERETLRHRQCVAEFGKEGVKLIDRAEDAIERILASDARRTGWLGQVGERELKHDLSSSKANLRKATAIRTVVAELSSMRNRTSDDDRTLVAARRSAKELEDAVIRQVRDLEESAEDVERMDETLRLNAEEARLAAERDEVRRRLDVMLSDIEMSPNSTPSEAAETVKARAAAFREVQQMLDELLRRQSGPVSDDTAAAPRKPSIIHRVRQFRSG